jgi:peptidoglycan/xylan/chitin deacetylase (PgdA/CDA1 family)
VLIVTYHAVADHDSPVTVTPARLAAHLRGLRDAGVALVSLDDCVEWRAGRRDLPPCSAVITFDDGYASVLERAVPILQQESVPAAVFVVAGRIGGDNRWPGQPSWIPTLPLVDNRGLRSLAAAGFAIGAHGWSHAALPNLPPEALGREIVESGDALEQVTGAPVRHFAYPYGRAGEREVRLARTRYEAAFSARVACLDQDADPALLPRIDAHDLHVALALGITSSSWLAPYLAARRVLRAMRPARRPA